MAKGLGHISACLHPASSSYLRNLKFSMNSLLISEKQIQIHMTWTLRSGRPDLLTSSEKRRFSAFEPIFVAMPIQSCFLNKLVCFPFCFASWSVARLLLLQAIPADAQLRMQARDKDPAHGRRKDRQLRHLQVHPARVQPALYQSREAFCKYCCCCCC